MTKKDFELIARTIKLMDLAPHESLRPYIASQIAEALWKNHPKFVPAKFMEACKN